MCGMEAAVTGRTPGRESAAVRVKRGAEALDLVYGPKWFRTENVSLGSLSRKSNFEFLFKNFDDGYVSFTRKLNAKNPVHRSMLFSPGTSYAEVDGSKFGFYDNADQLAEAWRAEIRTRRYNRPSKRRVSETTARASRSVAKEARVGA